MFLLRVVGALDAARVPHAIVGGYAVALHGAVRGTVDVDLVIKMTETNLVRAEKALGAIGLESRIPAEAEEVFRFRKEYIRNRGLTAWSFVNRSRPSEVVDIILTHNLADMKTVRFRVRGQTIKVASIDDLIRMKRGTGRDQDREDIKALRKLK